MFVIQIITSHFENRGKLEVGSSPGLFRKRGGGDEGAVCTQPHTWGDLGHSPPGNLVFYAHAFSGCSGNTLNAC